MGGQKLTHSQSIMSRGIVVMEHTSSLWISYMGPLYAFVLLAPQSVVVESCTDGLTRNLNFSGKIREENGITQSCI